LVALFALLGLVPLAFLTYFTIDLATRSVVGEVDARVKTTSTVTAELVRQQMQAVADLTVSYASRPLLKRAVGSGDPATLDSAVINGQLAELLAARADLGGAFLTDTTCRLTQVSPATPAIVGVDFSYRDWCRGVVATGGPYVSTAYRTAILGHPLVVAVATTVRAPAGPSAGRPTAILAVVYTLDALRALADRLARVQGIDLMITDQQATILVGVAREPTPEDLPSATGDPRVAKALAGRSGLARSSAGPSGDSLSAFAPVDKIGWSTTAEVPARQALAGVRRLRLTVLSVAALLALFIVAGSAFVARELGRRRSAERDLIDREGRTRAILDAASDAFVAMDSAGVITAWKGQAELVFGWSEAEAVGRLLSETIIPPAARGLHERGLARFLETGEGAVLGQRIEISALHRSGHEFPAELAVWPVRTADTWGFNAFIHDITLRKQAERDLEALNLELEAAARRDSLTGLGNRRALQEDLELLEARVTRYGQRYCMALIDVDLFKSYNDTYGHQAGDRILQAVAGQLQAQARAGDVIYRYGGEEFLCVFPEQSLDSGTVAVERMRAGLEAQAIPHLGSPLGVLTLSAGLAVLDLSGTGTADDVLKAADDCLYRAKGLGRNRIECPVPLPPEDIGEQAAT
jgi:diguanylate cyclase (GGDEF)-like protein/PAS domain S-box-containing protein